MVRKIGGAVTGRELKKLTEASYQKGKARPTKIGDLEIDRSLTTREAAVYHNPKTGEAVVTHRGTQGASDWLNNIALGVGLYKSTDRYKKGKETQQKVNAKYGKQNVLTTSHSQSGALAHELNKEGLVNKSVEVNPARLPNQKVMKNETIIKSSLDPVSIFVPKNKNVNLRFIYELMQQIKYIPGDHKRHWIAEYSQMEIIVPSTKKEQDDIATILYDMNNELDLLEKKLSKNNLIKNGMMQNLLT